MILTPSAYKAIALALIRQNNGKVIIYGYDAHLADAARGAELSVEETPNSIDVVVTELKRPATWAGLVEKYKDENAVYEAFIGGTMTKDDSYTFRMIIDESKLGAWLVSREKKMRARG